MKNLTFTTIGEDAHKFELSVSNKPLRLGGVTINATDGLEGNSDGDAVLHALTNAISGVSAVPILGKEADRLCLEQGVTASEAYVKMALATLAPEISIVHVSFSIEALKPKLTPFFEEMRHSVAKMLEVGASQVAFTATTTNGLTSCGRGEGIKVTCLLTVQKQGENE